MQPRKKKENGGLGKQIQTSETSGAASGKNGAKNGQKKQKKMLKATPGKSEEASPSTGNGLGSKKKKRKKSATPLSEGTLSEQEGRPPQPEKDSPEPETFPEYEELRSKDWRMKYTHDQVVKISSVRNMAVALDHHIAVGDYEHGIQSTESEGVWVALPYTRMYLDKMANTLCDHVAGRSEVALKDVLNDEEWAAKLMGVMEFAARPALGAGADAVLVRMNSAVDRVCAINEDYDKDADKHFDALLDAYVECMSVTSAIWLEVSDLVHAKFTPDPAKEAPPPVPTSSWTPGLVFNILDPRAELLGPGSSKYDSIEAVEDKWPTVFGTHFPISTIRSGGGSGKPTATEQKKVKEKNVGKKKKNKEEEEKEEEEEEGKKKKNEEEEEEEGKKKKKKKKNRKKVEEEIASLLSAGSLELGMRFWAR